MGEFKSFLIFFDKIEKIKFIFLSISIFFLAIIEAFSIALIFPIVGMFQNKNFIDDVNNDFLNILISFIDKINLNLNQLVIFTIIFAFIYLIKSIISFVIQKYQINYVWNIQKKLENKIFKNYLFSPYEFHVERQSSNLLKNIIQETSKVGNTILCSAYLISSLATILMILSLMIIIDPLISLASLLIFFTTNLFVFFNTRKLITRYGIDRYNFNEKRIESYSSGINNIKDIKVNEQENLFHNFAKKFNDKYFNSEKKIDTINIIPMLVTEFVFIIGVIFILHYINSIAQGGINEFIPKLSVFVAASIKLIPSINRAAIMINKIKSNYASVNSIEYDFNLKQEKIFNDDGIDLKFNNKISIKNLVFQFNEDKKIIDNVSLDIKKNTSICLFGPSGSGKSTLLDLLLGIINPKKGDILCDEISIYKNLKKWRKIIGFVPQSINILEDTLENNIIYSSQNEIKKTEFDEILKQSDLLNFVKNLPDKEKTLIKENGKNISGGQKQRIGIARALLKKPKILILDEPTSALDSESKLKIYKTLNDLKREITIILVTHDVKEVNFCNNFYQFNHNKQIIEYKNK